MTDIVNQFANDPKVNEFITVTGTNDVIVQMPSGTALMMRFKTHPNNSGTFSLGDNQAEADWPMSAGDDTGWIAANNLENYWYSGGGGFDQMIAWLQR